MRANAAQEIEMSVNSRRKAEPKDGAASWAVPEKGPANQRRMMSLRSQFSKHFSAKKNSPPSCGATRAHSTAGMRLEWDRPGRTSAARCFIAEPA